MAETFRCYECGRVFDNGDICPECGCPATYTAGEDYLSEEYEEDILDRFDDEDEDDEIDDDAVDDILDGELDEDAEAADIIDEAGEYGKISG